MNELDPQRSDDGRELSYPIDEEGDSLQQVHYWLKWEGLSGVMLVVAFYIPSGFVRIAMVGVAAVFTPFLLWHLVRARWYGAIAVFALVVGVPALIAIFSKLSDSFVTYFWTMLPLVCFYLYTWTLRFVIGEHLQKKQAVRQFAAQDRRRRQG